MREDPMIDTRAVAQEVQDQLMAAFHKGQEQFRKSQEQVRNGRDSTTVAVRPGNQLPRAVMPEVKLPSVSDLANREKLRAQAVARQRKLAEDAQELADHVFTTQRKLASRAYEMASPLVAEGVNRLTQVAGSFSSRWVERTEPVAPAAKANGSNLKATSADASTAQPTEAKAADTKAADTKATGTKATDTKAADAKASSTKAAGAKA